PPELRAGVSRMCPACLGTATLLLSGATSAGGLVALVTRLGVPRRWIVRRRRKALGSLPRGSSDRAGDSHEDSRNCAPCPPGGAAHPPCTALRHGIGGGPL